MAVHVILGGSDHPAILQKAQVLVAMAEELEQESLKDMVMAVVAGV